MHRNEIGRFVQNLLIFLGLIVNIVGGTCIHSGRTRIFTLIVNKRFVWVSKIMRKMATALIWTCYSFHSNCGLNIPGEVVAELELSLLGPLTLALHDQVVTLSWAFGFMIFLAPVVDDAGQILWTKKLQILQSATVISLDCVQTSCWHLSCLAPRK